MALRGLTLGGVYIAGGIFPKVRRLVQAFAVYSPPLQDCRLCLRQPCPGEARRTTPLPVPPPQATCRGAEHMQPATSNHPLLPGPPSLCAPQVLERVKQGGVREAFLWRASRFHDKVLKHVSVWGPSTPACLAAPLPAKF